MTTNFYKMKTMTSDGLEILGNWHAVRSTQIRALNANENTVITLNMIEHFSEKLPHIKKRYSIFVEDTKGFNSTFCYSYYTTAEAYKDWNFMVGNGATCPINQEKTTVVNYITNEVLEFTFLRKETKLVELAGYLYDMWGYRPVSHTWQDKLDKLGIADFQIEEGYGYVTVFWNEENEFFIRQYGF